jgi:endonuclease III
MESVRPRATRRRNRRAPQATPADQFVEEICRRLEGRYRSPAHGNKADPLDELVYILLSQMTTAPSFGRAYDRLRSAVPDWSDLLSMPESSIKVLIADAGLGGQRAARLASIARRLKSDFTDVTLAPLARMSDMDAEAYLLSLPGVGVKTAKCVLMYSLNRAVLPVDTHVARVSRRLGLLPGATKAPMAVHSCLEAVVPPHLRYSFHVNAIALGRDTCRAPWPRCSACVLSPVCPMSAADRNQAPAA